MKPYYYYLLINGSEVKYVLIHSVADLVDRVPAALAELRLNVVSRKKEGASDVLLKCAFEGHKAVFEATCVLSPTVETIERIQQRGDGREYPLLITVRLSDALAQACRERQVNYLDLNGRCRLKTRDFLIERHVTAGQPRFRLAERDIRFFSRKSSRLARALLAYPDRVWKQTELAEVTQISQGLLSRLLNYAKREGWLTGERGDWRVTAFDALLDAWAQADVWHKRVQVRQYSLLESDRDVLARQLVSITKGELVFTQWFAANLRHPYADTPVLSVYSRAWLSESKLQTLRAREVTDGGALWVLVPDDEGVFQCGREVDGLPLVSDAQIYLDLLPVGLRGPDQAAALRAWEGFCRT